CGCSWLDVSPPPPIGSETGPVSEVQFNIHGEQLSPPVVIIHNQSREGAVRPLQKMYFHVWSPAPTCVDSISLSPDPGDPVVRIGRFGHLRSVGLLQGAQQILKS